MSLPERTMSTSSDDLASSAFDPTSVDEETRQLNELIEKTLAALPPIHTRVPADVRREREEGKGPFPPLQLSPLAREREVAGPSGAIKLRVFERSEARAVYLHIHGGGWTLGGAHHQDPLLIALAEAC